MDTCCHEHVTEVIVVYSVTTAAVDCDTAGTPDKFNGIVGKNITGLVLGIAVGIVPHSETVITVISDVTVIYNGI